MTVSKPIMWVHNARHDYGLASEAGAALDSTEWHFPALHFYKAHGSVCIEVLIQYFIYCYTHSHCLSQGKGRALIDLTSPRALFPQNTGRS